jgi:hypothetical protein
VIWALVGVFGALHFVMSMIPLFVLSGGGGFISLGVVSAVIIGFLLGPVYGTLSAIIGAVLGVAIFNIGGIVGPLVPVLSTASSAFVAGSLRARKPRLVLLLYTVGFAAFIASPIGLLALPYIWLHLVAFICAILFVIPITKNWLNLRLKMNPEKPETSLVPVFLLSFVAVMADHLMGGALGAYWFTWILGWDISGTAIAYVGLMFAYPLERLAIVLVVTAAVLALTRALDKAGISLPLPSAVEAENDVN